MSSIFQIVFICLLIEMLIISEKLQSNQYSKDSQMN